MRARPIPTTFDRTGGATREIRWEIPETLVLVLTALDESAGLSDSLKAGAAGYVLKDAPASRTIDAVRRTLAGESPLDEKVAMRLLGSLMDGKVEEKERSPQGQSTYPVASHKASESAGSRPDASLTPREAEVLKLVVLGRTNQQISRSLSISVSTVKRHVRRIGEKLGAQDRVQAAVRAVELGVLDERSGGYDATFRRWTTA
jgi:DNA-binding NarL/FixJ family response regulator